MTVYVKTISGKTTIVKCDKKQRAATMAETVERRAAIPRDMMYLMNQGKVLNARKTTLGMEKNEQMDTQETEEDREKLKI